MPIKKAAFVIVTIICIFLFGVLYIFFNPSNKVVINKSAEPPAYDIYEEPADILDEFAHKTNEYILAYITGEVNNPDVYELNQDSRVKDLILAAGGFTDDADTIHINLSKKISDEEHIHVYKIGEDIDNSVEVNNDEKKSDLININTASAEQLKTLPSVGDGIASNIITYREQNGKFSSIEEIKNVDRIGEKTFETIKNLICVN